MFIPGGSAIPTTDYTLTNSLRFRSSASAYLSRTPASAGNRRTYTFSAWVKRGALNSGGTDMSLFNAGTTSPNYDGFRIKSDTISFYQGGAVSVNIESTQVLRDPSAWYHLVLAVDTTQATASNRVKIYINGTQVTAFGTANYPALNAEAAINNTFVHNIAAQYANTSSSSFFDGYMDEINFIDGQALTPSSFGSTNATTGVWQPARYTGTYGTNGFYLNFTNIALTSGSNTGLGQDFSGNGNFWNTNNISVTAGTTYDAMLDVPTLTSATAGNYCTLNSAIRILSGSVTEGNLRGAGSDFECWGTIAFPSTGKFYFEYTQNGSTGAGAGPATGIQGINPPDVDYGVHYHRDGRKWVNGTYSSYGATFTTNDIIGVAYDADSNSITFYKNNVSQGAISTTSGYTYLPYQFDNSGNGGFLNFGQRPFAYTPPTGFNRLNAFNLPNSTIVKGNTVMDATLATGNNSTQVITNAAGFRPDFVWLKIRSASENHIAYDSVRGAQQYLVPNLTLAEATLSSGLTSFNSNGFTLGNANPNYAGSPTFVGWQWQAGQGTNTTNTAGSITSTVSVNTTAGFSIVTYTNSAGRNAHTVGHGLGVAPRMFIIKTRSATADWVVYHASLGATRAAYLNLTLAEQTSSTFFNNTAPTSTVMTLGSGLSDAGVTIVAYCWAQIAGFSAFGSYTGNGSTDGTFVYTGFRPKYILIKRTNLTEDWYIYDTSRITYNLGNIFIYADLPNAENTGATGIDILSNGFKQRQTGGGNNASGSTYIYAAFAENPFKNALAR